MKRGEPTGLYPEVLDHVSEQAADTSHAVMATTPSGPADPGAPAYLGSGGGTTEAALGAFPHYVDGLDEPELAPAVPDQRPDLPQEELDAQLEANTEKLRQPDEQHVTEVVNSLVGMSDAQRKEALADLSDEEFDAMMDNLPPGEHEKLNELVGATDDPKRKLRVWSAGEQAELGREGRNLENIPQSGDHIGDEERLLLRRMEAVSDAKHEVTDEVDLATEQLDDPNVSDEEKAKLVDELIARKEMERDLERKYGVNFTNDKGGDNGRFFESKDRVVWSSDDLEKMDVVLDRLPDDAVQENPDLRVIRRARQDHDWSWDEFEWTEANGVAEAGEGEITIYDDAFDDTQDHHGDSSPIAGFDQIQAVQQTMAHEIGHIVDEGNRSEGAQKVKDVAGWKTEEGDEAEANVAACENGGVAPDGRIYVESDGEIHSYDPALLPKGGAHSPGGGKDKDTWSYARSDPDEYFAEMYGKAVVAPELLYQDLVAGPAAKVEELKANGASQDEIREAERVQESMAAQHATMREEVFDVDPAAVEEDIALMEQQAMDSGMDDEQREQFLAQYRHDMAQAMTPEQIAAINAGYENELYTS